MARRPQMKLDTIKAAKPTTARSKPEPAAVSDDKRRGQTLRLTVDAWKQLKMLAVNEEKTAHELLLEGVNLLFRDRGLPPIA